MTQQKIRTARELGRKACIQGKHRIPLHDENLLSLLTDKESIDIFKYWLIGYDAENLK